MSAAGRGRGRSRTRGPSWAQARAFVADHVQQRGPAHDRGVLPGLLGEGRADQQTAVGRAHDRDTARLAPAGGEQVVGGGGEVVEGVLLVLPAPGQVPPLALLTAAAQSRPGEDTARPDPRQHLRPVTGRHDLAEAPVPVSSSGRGTSGRPVGEITNIPALVPSREGNVTCRVCAPPTLRAGLGGWCQRVTRPVSASIRSTRGGVTKSVYVK